MKFKVIPNQQTPEVFELYSSVLISTEIKMLRKYLSFASRQHNCAGLAANQVSLGGHRIMERFFAIKDGHFWDIVIDPKILKYKGTRELKEEGCLTWLGKKFKVFRVTEIEVSYFNLKGDLIKETISGFKAQIWQHEYDHLNGVVEDYK